MMEIARRRPVPRINDWAAEVRSLSRLSSERIQLMYGLERVNELVGHDRRHEVLGEAIHDVQNLRVRIVEAHYLSTSKLSRKRLQLRVSGMRPSLFVRRSSPLSCERTGVADLFDD